MSEECTHNCSTCSANCDHRAPQHEPPHPRSRIRKVIGVVSGKGGVGKSMTSAMMAVSMRRLGYKAGVLDADITGPSIPRLFGVHGPATGDGESINPIPSRTGVTIAPKTFRELSKHPNIVAVKEASGNFAAIAQTRYLCGDDLDFYSGEDGQIVPLLSLGGIGVISVLSHVAPKAVHDICSLFFEGKVQESAALQLAYMDLIQALFADVNPIPVKEAVNLMGFEAGPCRMPLCPMSGEDRAVLVAALKNHGIVS